MEVARAPWARPLACLALSALRRVAPEISTSELVVSSRALACWLAPWATDWLLEAISLDAAATCSDAVATWERLACRFSDAVFSAFTMIAYSPGNSFVMRAVRSREASRSTTRVTSRIGPRTASVRALMPWTD